MATLVLLSVLALGSVSRPGGVVVVVGLLGLAIYVAALWRRVARRRSWLVVELSSLSDRRFHAVVDDLLTEFGYRGTHEVDGGEGWADIRCRDRENRSVLIRWQRPPAGHAIRSREVKRFIRFASTHPRPDRRMFVTTSEYTLRAWQLARQHHVRAIRGVVLARLVEDVRTHREADHTIPIWDRFEL
jgi:restriction endonuclease Mrr